MRHEVLDADPPSVAHGTIDGVTTLLFYLVIAAVIALGMFLIAVLVFGRGEQMAPLDPRTSPAELPDRDITSDDVRRVRFPLALRGYRMSDVDWTLERLGEQLDSLRQENADLRAQDDSLVRADADVDRWIDPAGPGVADSDLGGGEGTGQVGVASGPGRVGPVRGADRGRPADDPRRTDEPDPGAPAAGVGNAEQTTGLALVDDSVVDVVDRVRNGAGPGHSLRSADSYPADSYPADSHPADSHPAGSSPLERNR